MPKGVFSNPTLRARRISQAKRGRSYNRPGYRHSSLTIQKIRAARVRQMPPVPRGFTYPNSVTPQEHRFRLTAEYKDWRIRIFKRDDYTCQLCGKRGGKLNADHILPYSLHPTKRLKLDNGRTLCVACHRDTPTFGAKVRKLKTA